MKKMVLSAVLTVFATVVMQAQPRIIYVKSDTRGTGSAWNDACELDSAVVKASRLSGDVQIWVEQGIHTPKGTLRIPENVKMYGGFRGVETNLWERNYAIYPTIIDARKTYGPVVHLSRAALLSGFTVQNGISSIQPNHNGGGVYMEQNAEVANCHILHNIALNYGGGIYAEENGLVINTLLKGNSAGIDGFAVWGTTLTLRNNTITENQQIQVTASLPDSADLNLTVCEGDKITLEILEPGTYLWSTGETTSSIVTPALRTNTTYSVTVTTHDREAVYVVPFTITVKGKSTLTVSANKDVAEPNETVQFMAQTSLSGGTFSWTFVDFGDGGTESVTSRDMPADSSDLEVSCTYSFDGCETTETLTVHSTVCKPPIAPNAITVDHTSLCQGGSTTIHIDGGARNSGVWKLYQGSCGGTVLESSESRTPSFEITAPAEITSPHDVTYYVGLEGCDVKTECQSVVITFFPAPQITAPEKLCEGSVFQLQSSTSNGVWDNNNSSCFYVDSETGMLIGLRQGIGTVSYRVGEGCSVDKTVEITATPSILTSEYNLCQGSQLTYSTTHPGGVWSSATPTIVDVSVTGVVTASNTGFGDAVLRYTHATSGCFAEQTVRVHRQPIISGVNSMCLQGDLNYAHFSTNYLGGQWSVDKPGIVTTFMPGFFVSLSSGEVVLTYNLGYCQDTMHITVEPGSISVVEVMCEGAFTTARVDASIAGGVWATSVISGEIVATVDPINPTSALVTAKSAGRYDLTYTSPFGCTSTAHNLTIMGIPAVVQGRDSVCTDQTITLTGDPLGGQWTSATQHIANIGAISGMVTPVSVGKATFRYTVTSAHGTTCFTTRDIEVVEGSDVQFNMAAQAQSVCYDAPITPIDFTIKGAEGLQITWRKNGVPVTTPGYMPQGLTYNPSALRLSGNPTEPGTFIWTATTTGHYHVCGEAIAEGSITVFEPLNAGRIGPNDYQEICFGASLSVLTNAQPGSGGNTGSSYQWQISFDNSVFSNIPGATTPTYAATSSVGERWYRRMLVNSCGSVESNVVHTLVHALPIAITEVHKNNNSCDAYAPDGFIEFTAPLGSHIRYKLSDMPEQSSPRFEGLYSGTYTLTATDINTTCIRSFSVHIDSIHRPEDFPILTILSVSPNDSICDEGFITITPNLSNAGSTQPSVIWTNDVTIMKPVICTDTILNEWFNEQTTTYTLTVITSAGCERSISQTIYRINSVTVNSTPWFDTVCIGQTPRQLVALTNNGGNASLTYQWQRSATVGGTYATFAGAPNANTFTLPSIAESDYFYRCIVTNDLGICDPDTTASFHIKVLELPTVPTFDPIEDRRRCGDGAINLIAHANHADSILWYDAYGVYMGWTVPNTGSQTTGHLTAPTTAIASYQFTAVSKNIRCSSLGADAIVQIHPTHALALETGDIDFAICQGSTIQIPITHSWSGGSTAGTESSIVWTSPDGGNSHPAGLTSFNATSISGTVSTSALAGDYTWTVTTVGVAGNICNSDPKTSSGKIKVNALPIRPNITATEVTGCGVSNGTVTIDPINDGNTYAYSLFAQSVSVGTGTSFAGLPQNTYTVRVENTATGCVSTHDVTVGVSGTQDVPTIAGFDVTLGGISVQNDSLCSTQFGALVITPNISHIGGTVEGDATFSWTWNAGSSPTRILSLSEPPANTTEYTFRVTNDINCFAELRKTIHIIHPVEIRSVPWFDTVCIGQTPRQLVAHDGNGGNSSLTYEWQRSSTVNGTYTTFAGAPNSNTYTLPSDDASDYFYRCVVTNNFGICGVQTTASFHIKVLETPRATPVANMERCGNGSVNLVVNATDADSVRWFLNNVQVGSTTPGGTFNTGLLTATTIAVTTTYFVEASNIRCASPSRVSITATVHPEHFIAPEGEQGNIDICQGSTIDITNAITHSWSGGAMGADISWAPFNPGLNSSPSSIYGTATAAPGEYRWTITTTGVGTVCNGKISTGTITVKALPEQPSLTHSPNTACIPSLNDGSITVTNPVAGHTYSINGTDYGTGTTFGGLPTVGLTGDYTIYVRNSDGCVSNASIGVTNVQAIPTGITLTVDRGDELCSSETGDITITPDVTTNKGSNPTYAWLWMPGNGSSTTVNLPLVTSVPGATTTYTVTVTSNTSGCSSAPVNKVVAIRPDLLVTEDPTTPFEDIICSGSEFPELSIQTNREFGMVTHQWQINTGSGFGDIAGATSSGAYRPTAPGSYQVVVQDNDNLCDPQTIGNWVFTFSAQPTIAAIEDVEICVGADVVFEVTTTNAAEIKWYLSENAPLPFHTTTVSGGGVTVANLGYRDAGTHTFWADVSVEGCDIVARVPATVTVHGARAIQISNEDLRHQGRCPGDPITAFSHTLEGAAFAPIVWTVNEEFDGIPSGINYNAVDLNQNDQSATISGTPTVSGKYQWTLTAIDETGGTCPPATSSGTITVHPLPAAVTVEPSGSFCDSVVLYASGGEGGYIFWQVTENLGIITNQGTTPQTIKTFGTNTYYFRARSAEGCWGTQGSTTVTVGVAPSISWSYNMTNTILPTEGIDRTLSVTLLNPGTALSTVEYYWYYVSRPFPGNVTTVARPNPSERANATLFAASNPLNISALFNNPDSVYFFFCITFNDCGSDTSEFSQPFRPTIIGMGTLPGYELKTCAIVKGTGVPEPGAIRLPQYFADTIRNPAHPNFGEFDFRFASDRLWEIVIPGTNGYRQVWTDVVESKVCATKYNFSSAGYSGQDYSYDCATRQGVPGTYFSYCAIGVNFNKVCQYPYRIPSRGDYETLARALGGVAGQNTNQTVYNRFVSTWGGAFNGYLTTGNPAAVDFSTRGYYWSGTEGGNAFSVSNLQIIPGSTVWATQNGSNTENSAGYGMQIRCVRDLFW
jgi:hypothetical protein